MGQDSDALRLARRQGGVISKQQVTEIGFTRSQVAYRVRTKSWSPISRLGYRLLEALDDRDVLEGAITLLPAAVVSRRSAAKLHEFTPVTVETPQVSVHSRTTHYFSGVSVHRCHDLTDHHVMTLGRLRVTTPERTIVDLAIELKPAHLVEIVQNAESSTRLSLERLSLVAAEVGRKGKPGTKSMRAVLARFDELIGVSALETAGRDLLRQNSAIPFFLSEFSIPWAPHRRFDDAFPSYRLAIEWDSFRWHGERDRFESDRRRDQEAASHGWRVLRFTWRDVSERPHDVVATVVSTLEALVVP